MTAGVHTRALHLVHRVAAGAGPRTSFFLTVGCLSVIAVLVLGVGGDGQGDQGAETTPLIFDEIPVGPDGAVPFGSTFPVHSTPLGAEVEVAATAMDWDATTEILGANSLTLEPEEGGEYVMLTLEGVYRGESDYPADSQAWMRAVYIAEDGTEHRRAFVVTPHYDDVLEQPGVTAGGTFLSVFAFELPAEIKDGGHFVLLDDLQVPEEGAWMAAS